MAHLLQFTNYNTQQQPRARNPRSPSPPIPDLPGIGDGPPIPGSPGIGGPLPSPSQSPICRGSGLAGDRRGVHSHPHPHPRFAGDRAHHRGSTPIPIPDLPGIGDHPHPRFPSGVPCQGRLNLLRSQLHSESFRVDVIGGRGAQGADTPIPVERESGCLRDSAPRPGLRPPPFPVPIGDSALPGRTATHGPHFHLPAE
jgi:hypothetical protein